nr:unnamed protein product [Callosobruchus chinensis]
MRVLFAAFAFAALLALATATQVRQCSGVERTIEDLSDRIQVGGCNKPPCRLRKDTSVGITMKFKPAQDVKNLQTAVSANILGVPFPFIGVDGESACNNIFLKDETTKAGCDLKAGEEYIYKNSIDVLKIYPRVKTVVSWGLKDQKGDYVICFEVPARITN